MAKALFEELVRQKGDADDWWIDSAGVSAFDGEPATDNTQTVAGERGLDLSEHRSKLAAREVVKPFSLVLVMEDRHREMMRQAFPEISHRIHLLKEMNGGSGDVYDPIGTDIVNYRAMAEEVDSILREGWHRIRELARDPDESKI